MRYNIIHDKKLIFFWLPKSGTISLMRIMAFLKYPDEVDIPWLASASPGEVWQVFAATREMEIEGFDYSDFQCVLFGRNPYARILSGFLDKYVNRTTVTPLSSPGPVSFSEFVKILHESKLQPNRMDGKIDFKAFCSATQDEGYKFYGKLSFPQPRYISLLEDDEYPEGALHHDPNLIRQMLAAVGMTELSGQATRLLINRKSQRSVPKTTIPDVAYWTNDHLAELQSSGKTKSISLNSFYPSTVQELFTKTYESEFGFYRDLGVVFDCTLPLT